MKSYAMKSISGPGKSDSRCFQPVVLPTYRRRIWCPEPESNRHAGITQRGILSPLCLPISPSGRWGDSTGFGNASPARSAKTGYRRVTSINAGGIWRGSIEPCSSVDSKSPALLVCYPAYLPRCPVPYSSPQRPNRLMRVYLATNEGARTRQRPT
jgi:hypothetical protein